mmetsp:Transcript_9037/g.25299  ORF Transcript_9037/g.25299 Transcript_9037/m.25299 type:complete len:154 (-) Transcript_9037:490-951(-)
MVSGVVLLLPEALLPASGATVVMLTSPAVVLALAFDVVPGVAVVVSLVFGVVTTAVGEAELVTTLALSMVPVAVVELVLNVVPVAVGGVELVTAPALSVVPVVVVVVEPALNVVPTCEVVEELLPAKPYQPSSAQETVQLTASSGGPKLDSRE